MTPDYSAESFQALLKFLSDHPTSEDVTDWPAAHLQRMTDAGVTLWDIPAEYGGMDLPSPDLLEGLRLMAAANLVTTFILTQRSAAVRRIATSDNKTARDRLLPLLKEGRIFATVGISHLTTSGQHLRQPLVQATPCDGGYRLDGLVPWATGATQADVLVTGGTLSDGTQLLAAVKTSLSGVEVQPPVRLMALNASQTGAIRLKEVKVSNDDILHGPMHGVMQSGTGGGAGSLGTSALAVGAACGSLQRMQPELDKRPELRDFFEPMRSEANRLTDEIQSAAAGVHSAGDKAVEQIRRAANSLALRTAQAWLAATKGAGFVAGHPAERAVRESMFFLVWSCPRPVLESNLRELACSALS